MLVGENLHFGYGARPVIRSISLKFHPGESVSLLGANGSGKTTLIKLLLGLLTPQTGVVRWEGTPIQKIPAKQLARKIAYVPQVHRTTFAYSVLEVVLSGRMPYQTFFSHYSTLDQEIAMAMLMKLGIGALRHRPYTTISGGERQLTLIARALAQGADTLIMDEPASALDYGHQIRLLEQILQLSQEGYTFIKSTHFPEHALWASNRVILLHQGQVVADGSAEATLTPEYFQQLFGVSVRVETIGKLRVCIPKKLRVPEKLDV